MNSQVLLRAVTAADLATFFAQQLDPVANTMAAFTAKDPADQAAFAAHWAEEYILRLNAAGASASSRELP